MENKSNPEVVGVGGAFVDLVLNIHRLPKPGETLQSDGYMQNFGGKAANMCILLGRMERKVAMIARVGSDQSGKQLVSQFESSNVDTSLVHPVPETPSGTCLILLNANGDNTIALAPGANDGWGDPFQVPEECKPFLDSARVVLLSSQIPERVTLAFAKYGQSKEKIVILDAGGRNTKIGPQLLQNLTILTLNEIEFALNVQSDVTQTTPLEELVLLARKIIHSTPGLKILLKIGARGSLYITPQEYYYVEAIQGDKPILDTTGAGDAHAGGFTFALTECKEINLHDSDIIKRCLKIGNICGYLSCTKLTSMASMPTLPEYKSLLAQLENK